MCLQRSARVWLAPVDANKTRRVVSPPPLLLEAAAKHDSEPNTNFSSYNGLHGTHILSHPPTDYTAETRHGASIGTSFEVYLYQSSNRMYI